MTISMQAFEQGIALLTDHFNRPLSKVVQGIWKEYLDRELNDFEFAEAIKHAILHCQFFPTAGQLVEAIKSTKEVRAIQEWQSILQASINPDDPSGTAYLSDRARVALQAVGGIYKVGLANDWSRQRMEKNFVTCYCQLSERDSKCLPPGSSEPSSSPGNPSEDPAPVPDALIAQIEALRSKMTMKGKGRANNNGKGVQS